jgi:hypothetical protein
LHHFAQNLPTRFFLLMQRKIKILKVLKLINSYKPFNKFKIYFDYDYHFKFLNNLFINFFMWVFFKIFINQKNLMSVYIKKI